GGTDLQRRTNKACKGEAWGGFRKKMMVPLLQILKARQDEHKVGMEKFYRYAGISRQGFFQAAYRQQQEQLLIIRIEKLVQDYRQKKDRRAGSRSLYFNLKIKTRFNIGVNKFERLMSA